MHTPPLAEVAEILHAGRIEALVGLAEGQEFEAKGAAAYDLTTPAGRYELAKDASSFANASGGLIVIGLTHAKLDNVATEVVSGLELLSQDHFNAGRYGGTLAEYVYPGIVGLNVSWAAIHSDARRGVGVILVPAQRADDKPFIVARVTEDGAALKHIVVGMARRKGPDSAPLSPVEIQDALRKGMDSTSQRLSRMDAKLDALLEAAEPVPEVNRDEKLRDRIFSLFQRST